jgi:cytochrome c556
VTKRAIFVSAFALVALGASLAIRAEQGRGAAPAKPLVPLAANTLAANPDPYIGELVTLTAAVDQKFSRLAFSVDQDKAASTGKDVLVLARLLSAEVELNTYVTVVGEVVRFEPNETTRTMKDYSIDLPPDVIEKYRGRPVLLATAVVNPAGLDLARRLPPPMTAEDTTHSNMMKIVNDSNAALRKAIEGSDAAGASKNALALKQAFAETEAFWKARSRADAVNWALDARKQAEAIETASAIGKWEDVKTAVGTLAEACQSCHAIYRERFDDGSYRIRRPFK